MKCPDCGQENLRGEETCSSCHAPLSALAAPQPTSGMQKKILSGKIAELELHDAVTVAEETSVAEAVRLMREKRLGCVLVLRNGALAGVFSERDLLLCVPASKEPSAVKVSEAMRPDRETLPEDQPIAFAFHQMTIQDQRHVPVLRKDGSLAVVSARDLLRYLANS